MKPNVLIDALSLSAEKAYQWISHLNLAMDMFEIDSRNRQAAFLTFVSHESGHLQRTSVDLRLQARRIQAYWPSLFKTVEEARPFAGSGQALANYVFANCNGNGPQESGDGHRFRPRGLLPLCGRSDYERASFALEYDFIAHPDVLSEDHWAALSAGWYWHEESFNELADRAELDAITNILARRHLTDGQPERDEIQVLYREALQVMK